MPATFPIHLFEEHSSTLPIWWQNRSRPHTAVYLDAHLDLQQISLEQLQALQRCQYLDQFKSLESPHHLNPASRYSYGIENFLYPASQLKLIDRLIWVAPPHIPTTYSPALLEYIQQMDGISFEELCGFVELDEGVLRGQLMGLDITICQFSDLHGLAIGEDYYLDIDIDYFVTVPDDRLWIDPASAILQVQDQLGAPLLATVSRAVNSGHTPINFRFIGDYVAAVLANDNSQIEHFQDLYRAITLIDEGQLEQAITLCRQIIDSSPGCAASQFTLGMAMSLAGKDAEFCNAAYARATELDNHYAYDLARAASGFPNRNRKLTSEQLNALGRQLDMMESGSTEQAYAEVAIARLYADAGMLKESWLLLQKQTGDLANHGDLLLAIARGILASNEPYKARGLLELALDNIKTRTSATLHLGDLALNANDIDEALSHYQQVSDFAPAWIAPLERQLLCYKSLGEVEKYNEIDSLINHRKQVLSELTKSSNTYPL